MSKCHASIQEILKQDWNKLVPQGSPFLRYEFFEALELSGSIGPGTGWGPVYIVDRDGIAFTFIKTHSYGEYIFDWGWANAYASNKVPYYPKLTSMIPLTPATTPHFIMPEFDPEIAGRLLKVMEEIFEQHDFSSSHFLFIDRPEFFKARNYIVRESLQYHFFNEDYGTFENYLNHLKPKKAKTIRKERRFENVVITRSTGEDLTIEQARRMYQFYLSTTGLKQAIDYLKEDFFVRVFSTLKEKTLYVEASIADEPVAGALYFYSDERLYGRYWGSNQNIPNLHFELCYYQGIDFCLERNLRVFEAGAQGEHKIPRGFRPVRTYSAHKIKMPVFKEAIERFVNKEKESIEHAVYDLALLLPFK